VSWKSYGHRSSLVAWSASLTLRPISVAFCFMSVASWATVTAKTRFDKIGVEFSSVIGCWEKLDECIDFVIHAIEHFRAIDLCGKVVSKIDEHINVPHCRILFSNRRKQYGWQLTESHSHNHVHVWTGRGCDSLKLWSNIISVYINKYNYKHAPFQNSPCDLCPQQKMEKWHLEGGSGICYRLSWSWCLLLPRRTTSKLSGQI